MLLAHDSDPFNRWEAGQRLMPAPPAGGGAGRHRAGARRRPDRRRCAACCATRRWTRPSRSWCWRCPSEGYIAEQLPVVDPQRIHAVREQWRAQLAERLHADWAWACEQHQVSGGYSPRPAQAGRRALANLALAMLCLHAVRSGDAGVARPRLPALQGRRQHDRPPGRAARRWCDAQSPLADAALERFHALAHGDALVIDKWFMLQARAPEPLGPDGRPRFARAKALLQAPRLLAAQPEPRAQPAVLAVPRQPGRLPPRRRRRLRAAGPSGCWSSTPSTRSWPAAWRARWTAGRTWPSPTAAPRARPSPASARQADLSNDVREIVTRALEQHDHASASASRSTWSNSSASTAASPASCGC